MIVPAINYKEEIEKQFALLQYTDKMLWYTGSIDNYDLEVTTEGDQYQFAIAFQDELIGYISFRVDWYCSIAFNFSLIRFKDTIFSAGFEIETPIIMADAIREVMRMIESFHLHKIDFRCVSGNPAEKKYDKIVGKIIEKGKYNVEVLTFRDNIKDRQGKYHDTICYELIRREE